MSRQKRPGGPYVAPLKATDGTGLAEAPRGAYTLVAGATYYYPLGVVDASMVGVQIGWDAAAILTITYEESNVDVPEGSDWVTDASLWTPLAGVSGAAAGGSIGSAMLNAASRGARRARVKVVVGGTGGVVRVSAHGKD